MTVDGARLTRGDLMDGGIEVDGGAVAVPTGEDASAHAPGGDVHHLRICAMHHRLVIAPPLLQERLATVSTTS